MMTDSSPVQKQLQPGEVRFVAKSRTTGRSTAWYVYDLARGSYPGRVFGFGLVAQAMASEAEAEAEAARLAAYEEGNQ